jgi:DNA-binding XRE family transcriptional regulator
MTIKVKAIQERYKKLWLSIRSRAAKHLGIDRKTVYNLEKRYMSMG